jgi:hypothetical protein
MPYGSMRSITGCGKTPTMFAKEVAAREMHFTLTNLSSSPVQAIWDRSYKDLVTKPAGIVLSIGLASLGYKADANPMVVDWIANARWEQGGDVQQQ